MNDMKRVNHKLGLSSRSLKRKWMERRVIIGKYSYPVKNLALIGVAIFLLISFFSILIANHREKQANPDFILKKETKDLTGRIGRFLELPAGEQPTLATVTDKDKLQKQGFFANAQNGDKLLVYSRAGKAILFRPSSGKIIEVSDLASGNTSQNNSSEKTSQIPGI